MQPEILAPAGGREQLIAAVRAGADAVYLGAKGFNARRRAENFEEATLSQAVAYAHARHVRVYVTVNTLVTDGEMPALIDTLREVAAAGADAVLVQDMAVARLIRRHMPGMPLHASTQMTIHNAQGALALREMGFSRAVLARELTIDEIARIARATDLELEAFVHGALCMCASGACYLSAMLGGRSGNRGLCAQPCRLDFSSAHGRGYALSLKDLSALSHVRALTEAGVCALKIEGRMKRPEYVAAAVTACRQAVAGEAYDAKTLEAVFSRGGFTDGYLTGRRNLSMFGVRRPEDAEASRRAQGALAALYRRERPAVPVEMTLTLPADAPATLCAEADGQCVTVTGEVPQPAATTPTDAARARQSLSKTGDTPFFLRELAVEAAPRLMLPAAALNAMRREALAGLLERLETVRGMAFLEDAEDGAVFAGISPADGNGVSSIVYEEDGQRDGASSDDAGMPDAVSSIPCGQDRPTPAASPTALARTKKTYLRFASAEQLWGDVQAERVILPLAAIDAGLLRRFGDGLAAEVPALLFPGEEEAAAERLAALRRAGLTRVWANNLGAVRLGLRTGLAVSGGYGLNVLNTGALQAYGEMGVSDMTVSMEMHHKQLAALGGTMPRGALVYGYLPLMQLRCCPAQGAAGCGGCNGHPMLTDARGTAFGLWCHGRRTVTLLNSVPLNLADAKLAGVDFQVLYFTNETAAQCEEILKAFERGVVPDGARTKGLYFRGVE
jgi:putative protease